MKIIEKDDEIILRDIPITKWIFGIILTLLFVYVGVLLVYDAVKFPVSTFGLQNSWYSMLFNILWIVFLLAIICGSLYLFSSKILTPMFVVRIRPNFQAIDIIRRRLFFFKHHQRFYFSQAKNFALVQREADNESLYFTILKLVNDDEIYLESSGSSSESNFHIISKLNDILKKHHSPNKGKTARLKRRKAKRKMKAPEK